jgi:hypothetical protein
MQPEAGGHRAIVVDVVVQPLHAGPGEVRGRLQHLRLGDVAVRAVVSPEEQDAQRAIVVQPRVEIGRCHGLHRECGKKGVRRNPHRSDVAPARAGEA